MPDYILLVKNLPGQSWYLHETSFYTFDDAREFARQLIDAGLFYAVSIGECNTGTDVPPTFNYTYTAK